MAGAKDFIVNILGDSSSVDKVFEGFQKNAGKIAAGAAAAFAAVKIGDIISGNMDIAQGQAKMQAQLGSTADESERLGNVAGQVWSKGFTGSMPEVNDALVAVSRNIGGVGELGEKAMGKIATKALVASGVMGEDLGQTTAAVGKMLTGNLADSADEAFDILATGFANGNNGAGDLLDTFTEYSVQFDQLGLDGETALGLINQGMESTARNSDVVADALKEFAIRGQGPVVKATMDQAAASEKAKTAGESLSRAQDDEKRAQISLTEARKSATDQLADMADELVSAELSERGAVISKARAKEELDRVMADPKSSELDRKAAQLGYDQAVQSLKEQKEETKDLRKEKRDADKNGVEGSAQVVSAQQAVKDASKSVSEAQKENTAAQQESSTTLTTLGLAYQSIGVDGVAAQQAIAAGGPGAKQALTDVLDGLRGVDDPAERAALAVTFFGTKAEDLQSALYALDPSTAAAGLDDVAGASDRMVASLAAGPLSKVNGMKNEFNEWTSSMIATEGPIGDVSTWMTAFGPGALQVAAAIGPLIAFTAAKIANTAATVPNTAVVSANNLAWLASPVTWIVLGIIAAIAGLVVAGIWLVQNWDGVVQWLGEAWQNILNGAKWVIGAVVDAFLNFTPLGIIIKNWGAITDWFGSWWSDTTGMVDDGVAWIGDGIDSFVGFFTDIPDRVGDAWTGLIEIVKNVMHEVTSFAVDTWNNTIGQMDFDLPDIMGGGHISFGKLTVPALAEGGIVTGPTLALIGEAGPEAVVPLSQYHSSSGSNSRAVELDVPIVLNVDGKELARILRRVEARERF